MPLPPFWRRLLLPFDPRMWAAARAWPTTASVGPLFLLAVLTSSALGAYRGMEFRGWIRTNALTWDERFDPVVVEKGRVRVDGARLPRFEEQGQLLLVDPAGTVPPSEYGRRYVVVKETVIVDNSNGPARETPLATLWDMTGLTDDFRIDAASILAFEQRWGGWLVAGLTGLLVASELAGACLGLLWALLAGLVLQALWSKRGLAADQGVRVALAVITVKPVLSAALALAGTSIGGCVGIVAWPLIATVLGSLALWRFLPPAGPAPGAQAPLSP